MNWFGQVLHVAAKDVRMSRWMILLYAALVAAATAAAVELPAFWADVGVPWVLFASLFGAVVLAVLIQADSPARSDAFWVTRPLDPSAVFAAKVLLALVIIVAPPLLGQLVTLLAHDVAPADVRAHMGSAVLSVTGRLAFAGVIAAVTRDLRTFILVQVLLFVLLNFGVGLVEILTDGDVAARGSSTFARFLSLAAALAILAHQYRTRNVRLGIYLVCLLEAANLLMGVRTAPQTRAGAAAPEALDASSPLVVHSARLDHSDGLELSVNLAMRLASGEFQYRVVSPVVRIHNRVITRRSAVQLNDPQLIISNFPPGAVDLARDNFTGLTFKLGGGDTSALRRTGGAFTIEGDFEIREARPFARVPLERGAAVTRNGNRFRVSSVQLSGTRGLRIMLRHSFFIPPHLSNTAYDWDDDHDFRLWNQPRDEWIALQHEGGSGSGFAFVVVSSSGMIFSRTLSVPRMFGRDQVPIDRHWLKDARLVILQWQPQRSYPVTVRGRLSDPTGPSSTLRE